MGCKLRASLRASELAEKLGFKLFGEDVEITGVSSLDKAQSGYLCFSKCVEFADFDFPAVVISPVGSSKSGVATIEVDNPRLQFARALSILVDDPGFSPTHSFSSIAESAKICSSAVIENGVVIGRGTIVGANVFIGAGTTIGDDCVIRPGAVIGVSGFGFERDESGVPIRMPHLGSVLIGDRVEIGSLNTVCRATLGVTVIEDDVKTDDHVHIAHNCRIRKAALLTACVELSGGVDVGERVWIGPNSSLMQKISIGNDSLIGIGSNVLKSIPEKVVAAGNPAKVIKKA